MNEDIRELFSYMLVALIAGILGWAIGFTR
jgi:hypothetical protein